MKTAMTFQRILALSLLACGVSFATDILDVTSAITTSDAQQLGRISRNGLPSDWSSIKQFPGIINPATVYYHTIYSVDTSYLPYLQITLIDLGQTGATFVSAYKPGYNSSNLAFDYLGDAGSSGFFPGDPVTFQIVGAINSKVDVVVNTTSPAGLGSQFELLVQAYSDTNFTDTPEPASFGLALAGILTAGWLARRKRTA